MQIFFVCVSLSGGGAERVIQTITKYLANNEHKVKIVCLQPANIEYQIDPRVEVVELASSRFCFGLLKLLLIPIQAYELSRIFLRADKPKIISFLVRPNIASVLSKLFHSFKVIISERNHSKSQYSDGGFRSAALNFLINKVYHKADCIIPISNGLADSLVLDYSVPRELIKVIYNPQDITAIHSLQVQQLPGFDTQKYVFVTLGRLVPQKDHETLLNAFALVLVENPESFLFILGDGPLQDHLTELIFRLKISDNVALVGFKSNAFDYLKLSDCFVFSSRYEGFGNVLVEAMACSLPIISTDCPSGPSEILEGGTYGRLVPVGDHRKLAYEMKAMMSDDATQRFAKLSHQRSFSFDVSVIGPQYERVLKNV